MAEVLFYHLTATPLEQALPWLIEKALARGWRVLVRVGSEPVLDALDTRLWTFRDDAFLPHGRADRAHADRQPVCLTLAEDNPNGADVLMLVDGARAGADALGAFARACLIFDGGDADRLEAAREAWRSTTAAGLKATYWAQAGGRWVQRSTRAGAGSG